MPHLLVLVHGLFGSVGHMETLEKQLQAKLDNSYEILNTNVNHNLKTLHSIETCATRVFNQVYPMIKDGKYDRISFIGYSMGGVVSRRVIGKLYEKNIDIIYEKYISIATPHISVFNIHGKTGGLADVKKHLLSKTSLVDQDKAFTSSLTELHLYDDYHQPYLLRLSQNENIEGFKQFKSVTFIVNKLNDGTVPYFSASLDLSEIGETNCCEIKNTIHKNFDDINEYDANYHFEHYLRIFERKLVYIFVVFPMMFLYFIIDRLSAIVAPHPEWHPDLDHADAKHKVTIFKQIQSNLLTNLNNVKRIVISLPMEKNHGQIISTHPKFFKTGKSVVKYIVEEEFSSKND